MRMHSLLPFTALLLISPALAADKAQDWRPDSIPWERANPDGTRFALLEGRRDTAAGAFSYAFFIPAGVWDGPHRHSRTARVFVARGTLWLGYGDRLDRSQARAFPAGSYVLVPAGAVHFDGSDRDTIIIGSASGRWSTSYVDKAVNPSAGTTPR
jgi:quercetin dioxygenase-like cupin family protein